LIEEELADLRKRVSSLEEKARLNTRDGWKQIIGTSKGQILDQEAARLGAEWRSNENKK